jgi:hypothetical protein
MISSWRYHLTDDFEVAMQVSNWGDSLAVRLPKAQPEKMGLSAGYELNIVDCRANADRGEGRPAQGCD